MEQIFRWMGVRPLLFDQLGMIHKTGITFFLMLCLAGCLYSQDYFLSGTNEKGNRRGFFEDERVKIKTIDGKKIYGYLKIVNQDSIQLDDIKLALYEISWIKKLPAVNQFLSYPIKSFGTAMTVAGLGLTLAYGGAGLLVVGFGTGVFYLGNLLTDKPKAMDDLKIEPFK